MLIHREQRGSKSALKVLLVSKLPRSWKKRIISGAEWGGRSVDAKADAAWALGVTERKEEAAKADKAWFFDAEKRNAEVTKAEALWHEERDRTLGDIVYKLSPDGSIGDAHAKRDRTLGDIVYKISPGGEELEPHAKRDGTLGDIV